MLTMDIDKTEKTRARYLDIIFPWDEELYSYESAGARDDEEGSIPMVSNGHWHGIIDLKEHVNLIR